jgi:phospho-N-acetylmuramoyl-pentapeptide-transferase
MLLWLLKHLAMFGSAAASDELAVLGKITLRAALAALVSFALAVLLGPRMIAWLRHRFREPIKCDSPSIAQLHQAKQSTPTMGGLFIVAGLMAGVLVFSDLANPYVLVSLLVVGGLALLGAVDDLVKLRSTAKGISARSKLAGQVIVATLAAVLLYQQQAAVPGGLQLQLPLTEIGIGLGLWFVPLAVLVMVGTSNAVNLTDGLDGLAGGCLIFATAAMTALVYAAGHAELAEYLHVPRIPGAGEMTIVAAAMGGGVLGFLWFNCHPAQVFMGDTGALPLGGLLSLLAMIARQELLLIVVGGVFVAEAGSVLLQIGCYRWRRRRVFLCAPLHHHFQLKGWPENKIVVRFWIASALCALLGMACLKLSAHEPSPNRPAAVAAVEKAIRR